MKARKWDWIVIGVLAVLMVVAGWKLYQVIHEYSAGKGFYQGLEEYVFLPEDTSETSVPSGENAGEHSAEVKTETEDKAAAEEEKIVYYSDAPQVDFEVLKAQNEDVTAWIYGAGTAINYPVVQGESNDDYLYRMFNGEENKCGSIFLDALNEKDFTHQNSIIHGHHMKNGTMFADLVKYSEQSYYDSRPMFWLVTPEKNYRIELFAGFVTDVNSDVWQISFATEDDFENWKTEMARKSYFKSEVVPQPGERVVTLATCSYEYDDARFVVMGVLR